MTKTNRLKPLQALAMAAAIAAPGFLGAGSALALDQDAQIELGKTEYTGQCAACHGPGGKGDGPVAAVLQAKPTDLTQLTQNYGGTFPVDDIYRFIDGRNMINPHGDRGMPVWGHRYMVEAVERSREVPHPVDAQALVLGRITALVEYLKSIQAE